MIFGFILAAAAIISAISTVKQYQEQKKQAKALNTANDMRRRQDLLRQAQERQQQVRQSRIQQARVAQAAVNQGAGNDSAAAGGFYSIGTQRNTNLGFLNANSALAQAGSIAESNAIKYGSQASMWGSIGKVSESIGSVAYSGYTAGGGSLFGNTAANTASAAPTSSGDLFDIPRLQY